MPQYSELRNVWLLSSFLNSAYIGLVYVQCLGYMHLGNIGLLVECVNAMDGIENPKKSVKEQKKYFK